MIIPSLSLTVPLRSSLAPFESCALPSAKALDPLTRVPDAEVSLFVDNKRIKSELGEIQFNKDSISGICVFNISREARIGLNRNRKVNLFVNLLPQVKYEDMVSYLDNKDASAEYRTDLTKVYVRRGLEEVSK